MNHIYRSVSEAPAGSTEGGDGVEIARLTGSFLAELNSVALYEALAELEPDSSRQSAYLQLAAAMRERAEYWAARMRSAGAPMPRIRIPRRMRLVAKVVRFLSGGFAIPIFTTRALGEHCASGPVVMRRADTEPS